MTLVLVLLLILVVGLAVAVTVGLIGGGLPRPATDVPPPIDGPVGEPADLDRARFQLAFRGYRMDQVDRVLDDARDALAGRDEEIARLRRALPHGAVDALAAPAGNDPVVGPDSGHDLGAGDGPDSDPADRDQQPAEDPFRRPTATTPPDPGERSPGTSPGASP